ncbi:MAG: chorismate synthase [Thermodesulfovibrionales bacterium]
MGYGRGGRMKIESDHAEIISGVRWGKTIGSPITLFIENQDYKNWLEGMSPEAQAEGSIPAVTRPRPGHADLSGAIKYNQHDIRNILERSSARETAMRVALGAIAKKLLSEFGVTIGSYVLQIGGVRIEDPRFKMPYPEIFLKAEDSPVRCPDTEGSRKMVGLIEEAVQKGDSLGGIFKIAVLGIPPGLGSHIQWDMRLDGRLAQAVMSIQAIKGVEIGSGFMMAERFGSEVMDEILYREQESEGKKKGFYRKTNHAGGIEGGMTNGMPITIKAAMKPIPTLKKPLRSVDIITKEPIEAAYERSDVCAVPAASVIGEAMTALIVADAFLEKCGGDSMEDVKRNYGTYMEYVKQF